MIVFPNAKINLGLQVTEKRPDGYHNLATVFFPIPFTDTLEAVRSDHFSFSTSGLTIDSKPENNLCIKAWNLLKEKYSLQPVAIHLHKIIPMGAGLGGGSSDGAFTLLLLNQLFQLDLSPKELISDALKLGSDCPFFILNQPAYATGRGEVLEPIDIPALRAKKILLIHPGYHVSTGEAFSQLIPHKREVNLVKLLQHPVSEWRGKLENDFEPAVFAKYPQLAAIQERLYQSGALYAGMTGSGSTIYGIFDEIPASATENWPTEYTIIPLPGF